MRFTRSFPLSLILAIGLWLPAQAAQTQSWSYDGAQNSEEEWVTLDKNYSACGNGKQQSPVQIGYTQKERLPPLAMHYGDAKVHLEQKDYTLAVGVDSELSLSDHDKTYRLVDLRFHTPSEHEVLGRFWPMEIQFLHRNDAGKMLIVSVFAEIGQSNPALQTLLDHVGDNTWLSDISFNPQSLIPSKTGYYAYTGSLTIPPCTEGVEWRVFKEPVTASLDQIKAMEKITRRNARLPQPVYMRTVVETE